MFELICIMAFMFLWTGVGKSAIGGVSMRHTVPLSYRRRR